MEKIYSGETDESPFGSNLVTPTDEQTLHFLHPALSSSMDERNVVAKDAIDHLGSDGNDGHKEISVFDAAMSESPSVEVFFPRSVDDDEDGMDDVGKEQNTVKYTALILSNLKFI